MSAKASTAARDVMIRCWRTISFRLPWREEDLGLRAQGRKILLARALLLRRAEVRVHLIAHGRELRRPRQLPLLHHEHVHAVLVDDGIGDLAGVERRRDGIELWSQMDLRGELELLAVRHAPRIDEAEV